MPFLTARSLRSLDKDGQLLDLIFFSARRCAEKHVSRSREPGIPVTVICFRLKAKIGKITLARVREGRTHGWTRLRQVFSIEIG